MIELFLSRYHFSFLGIKAEAINGNTHKEVTRKPSDGTSHVSHRKIIKCKSIDDLYLYSITK